MKKQFTASRQDANGYWYTYRTICTACWMILTTLVYAQPSLPVTSCNFLKKIGGATSSNGAEIAAFHPATKLIYSVAGPVIEYYTLNASGAVVLGGTLPFGFTPPAGTTAIPNSVAVNGNILAAGFAIVTNGTGAQQQGRVTFYNATTRAALHTVTVGYLPDMITFTADGNTLLTANEGEPNSYNQANSFDPEGSVSIIDISNGVQHATVAHADFAAYNGQANALKAAGVRLYGPNASVAQDLEPEYIALAPTGDTAWVTLQEANAIGVLHIPSATFTSITPLGLKDHSRPTVRDVEVYTFTNMPSIGMTPAGEAVTLGGNSGLAFEGYAPNGNLKFITHTDRGPNAEPTGINRPFFIPTFTPEIVCFELNRTSGQITITQRIQLKTPSNELLTGLPNTALSNDPNQAFNDEVPVTLQNNVIAPLDPMGADLEGIYKAADSTFWMVDEYRPAIYHFNAAGVMLQRYVPIGTAAAAGMPAGTFGAEVLPAVLAQRRQNRGFEAIAFQNGKIYAFIQSPIRNPIGLSNATLNGLKNVRVIEFNPATETTTGQFVYALDNPAPTSPTDTRADKIGDAIAVENGEFLVLERDDDAFPADPIADIQKKIYRFSLTGATNIHALPNVINGKTVEEMTPAEMTAAGITPIIKYLHIDLAPSGVNARQKPEGLALIDRNTLAIVNDNDFGVAGAVINTVDGTFTPDPNAENSVLAIVRIQNNGFDGSDRDFNGMEAGGGIINIRPWPVKGMYMPDAISSFSANGQTYYVTANEGDSRAWPGYSEEIRVGAGGYVLDPAAFPNAAFLKQNINLGRLQLTSATGNTDGDSDFDQIHALGTRSFSIWNSSGQLVYDSGDDLEQITAALNPIAFNSDGLASNTTLPNGNTVGGFDSRSDNKGPETEAIATGEVNGRTYAFVGMERVGDLLVYDITDPEAPVFVQYLNTPGDIGLEGLLFVPAAQSPTRRPLVIAACEVSYTIAVFEINTPVACAIKAVPDNFVYTGGVWTNLYLGYGPQQLTLKASAYLQSNDAPYTYSWTGDAPLSNYNTANPVFTATTPGTFNFTVTISTQCGVSTTCGITICVMDIQVPGQPNHVYLCHSVPGSPSATLEVPVANVNAHLTGHAGDRLGICGQVPCQPLGFSIPDHVLSEDELEEGIDVMAYPNPTLDEFILRLHSHEPGDVQIRVMDLQGRVVHTATTQPGMMQFGSDLAIGMYILEVTQGVHKQILRLAKQ